MTRRSADGAPGWLPAVLAFTIPLFTLSFALPIVAIFVPSVGKVAAPFLCPDGTRAETHTESTTDSEGTSTNLFLECLDSDGQVVERFGTRLFFTLWAIGALGILPLAVTGAVIARRSQRVQTWWSASPRTGPGRRRRPPPADVQI